MGTGRLAWRVAPRDRVRAPAKSIISDESRHGLRLIMWLSAPHDHCERTVPAAASSLVSGVLGQAAPVLLPVLAADMASGTRHESVADLREQFGVVPDPRARRGVRHALGFVLVIAAAAVAAGARSFTAIGEWAADAPQRALALLGARRDRRGWYRAPDEATVRRVLQAVDPDAVDAAIGGWLASQQTSSDPRAVTAIAVDGKTLRGTCRRDGTGGVHLLAAMTHHAATVVAQTQVRDKTSEIAAPSRSCRHPTTSGFLLRHKRFSSSATSPTRPPARPAQWRYSASPASPPTPTQPGSLPWSEDIGRSRTDCTGSATSPTTKTHPTSAPAPHPASWPASATSPSAHYAKQDTPTSPPHSDTPPATPHDHSPCSESTDQHQRLCRNRGDRVGVQVRTGRRISRVFAGQRLAVL